MVLLFILRKSTFTTTRPLVMEGLYMAILFALRIATFMATQPDMVYLCISQRQPLTTATLLTIKQWKMKEQSTCTWIGTSLMVFQ